MQWILHRSNSSLEHNLNLARKCETQQTCKQTVPGGGTPIQKKYQGARRKFCKEPLRDAKVLFCGLDLEFFSPLRGTNSYITHFLVARHIFSAQYPKKYRTSSHWGPFEAEY